MGGGALYVEHSVVVHLYFRLCNQDPRGISAVSCHWWMTGEHEWPIVHPPTGKKNWAGETERGRKEKRERERENNNDTVSSLSSVGNRGSEELGIFGLSHPGLHWLASCLWELTWETIGGTNYKFNSGNETLSLGLLWKILISSSEYLLFWKEGIPGKIILADTRFFGCCFFFVFTKQLYLSLAGVKVSLRLFMLADGSRHSAVQTVDSVLLRWGIASFTRCQW